MYVNNWYMIRCVQLLIVRRLVQCDQRERQQSVNDFQRWVLETPMGCVVTLTHNRTIGRLSTPR